MAVLTRKITACCLSLAAFAVATFSGLFSDVPTAQILLRAILAMIVCYPIGFIVGMLCEYVVVTDLKSRDTAEVITKDVLSTSESEQTHAADSELQESVMNA